jgi:hypothetical protein
MDPYSRERSARSYSKAAFQVTLSKSTSPTATVGMVAMIGMNAGGPGGTKPTNGRVSA